MNAPLSIDMLAAAMGYAANGKPVFPCNPANKRPFTDNGFHDASTDQATIAGWWQRWPNAMIGMPTGAASGCWVLDIDNPELFEANCPVALPATHRADTGKGYHLYFEFDPKGPIRNAQFHAKKGWPFPTLPGAETRGEGGYVILPPSRHPNGRRYAWATDCEPVAATAELVRIVTEKSAMKRAEAAPKAVSGGLGDHVRNTGDGTRYGLAALADECAAIRSAGAGAQEGALNEAALKIGALVAGKELSRDAARSALISAGCAMPSYNPSDCWTPEKIIAKVDRGMADGASNPRSAPKDNRGAADQFDPETGELGGEGPSASARPRRGIKLTDFHAYMPAHNYIFAPSGEFWPGASINSRIPPIPLKDKHGNDVVDDKGNVKTQPANQWLDQHRAVEQMTWAPGEPQVVSDRLISDGGWIARPDCNVFNLYRPPVHISGDGNRAGPWLDHIRLIYPDDADHIINWLAHRVQRPSEKINHAIVMGGAQGIGKDTILEPVKAAIGPWNFAEVSPQHMLGRFNGFVKSVILRVSEARDLGDVDRFAFYDHMKTYTAAPPDVLRVDEKFRTEYSVFNVCGVIITTNHKTDGIFLPADDRRHYVAWSDSTRETFDADYWPKIYGWYASGGIGHVAAYLRNLSLAGFDPKAPPPKTPAFWDIVSSNQAPEDAELADAIDELGKPRALTIGELADKASWNFRDWLTDRRNSRKIPHRLEECGYTQVRNRDAMDGLYKVKGKRCAIYAQKCLSPREAIGAADAVLGRTGQ